jgi:DNA-binding transcriptional regulator YiaG
MSSDWRSKMGAASEMSSNLAREEIANDSTKKAGKGSNLLTPEIFLDGMSNTIASAMVIWEGCNLLAQRHSLSWTIAADGKLSYLKPVKQGQGVLQFGLTETFAGEPNNCLSGEAALQLLDLLDLRAACLHLIYAAYATLLERPWEQEFTVSDRQIAAYLGLDKRKDLLRRDKLELIQTLALQPCQIVVSIQWPPQGKIAGFCVPEDRLWNLTAIEPNFLEVEGSQPQVSGLIFTIRAGEWSRCFLNSQGYREKTAFYQYTTLPKSLLEQVMGNWQHHEGAVRMVLWLFFKIRLGQQQPLSVFTLMKVAYGEEKLLRANSNREERKRRIRTFERDLEVLFNWGFKPVFDPATYPPEIQPLWWKLLAVPDDSEAEAEFWQEDALKKRSILDPAPRGKWQRLLNARILEIELEPGMAEKLAPLEHKKQGTSRPAARQHQQANLTGEQVKVARKNQNLSQRELASLMEKSQSWVRDVESGRLKIQPADRKRLQKILCLI